MKTSYGFWPGCAHWQPNIGASEMQEGIESIGDAVEPLETTEQSLGQISRVVLMAVNLVRHIPVTARWDDDLSAKHGTALKNRRLSAARPPFSIGFPGNKSAIRDRCEASVAGMQTQHVEQRAM